MGQLASKQPNLRQSTTIFNELKNAYKPKYSDDELITIFEDDKPIKHKKNTPIKIMQTYTCKF